MNAAKAIVIFAFVVGAHLTVTGAAQIGQSFTVKDVVVEGLKEVALVPVMDQLTFKVGDTVTLDDVRASAQRIFDMGLFKRVDPQPREESDGVVIVFQLEENPVLQAIEVSGNRQYETKLGLFDIKIPFYWEIIKSDRVIEILRENNVLPYQIVNRNDVMKAIEAISKVYQEKGYTLFKVDVEQVVNSIVRGDVLRIPIVEYLIEEMRIEGLEGELEQLALKRISIPQDEPARVPDLQQTVASLTTSIFFQPAGEQAIEPLPGSKVDRLVLVFRLQARQLLGAPALIESIQFEGNTVYSQERLQRQLGAWDKTQPVGNLDLLHVLDGAFSLYQKNGYARLQLDSQLSERTLTVRMDEGRLGDIAVRLDYDQGYTLLSFPVQGENQVQYFQLDEAGQSAGAPDNGLHTKPYVIEKTLVLEPGEVFNAYKIRDSVRTLLNLGYFDDVQVGVKEHEGANSADLELTIIERKKLGSLNGALSFSDNGLVGKLSVAEKNLFGTGQDLSLDYDRGIFGPARTNWSLNYSANGFFPTYKSFNVRLFQSFERPSFDEELSRAGGELSLTYPLTSSLDFSVGGRHENFQECLRDGKDCQAPGITDSVTFGLVHDTRDTPLFPMEGGRQSVQIEKAGGFSVGTEFTKVDGAWVHHVFLLEDHNVSGRWFAGWGDGMPSQEKFVLGGAGSVRGLVEGKADWLSFVNLEFRSKWVDGFTTALFTDWGFSNNSGLMGTVGIETRITVPFVGLTRLILAWPLNDPNYRTFVPRFQFSFGPMF